MPYRLDSRESVQQGLRRCAREQLDRAIEELTENVRADPVDAVHSARKALKKERSLLRLFRGALDSGERRRENDALRDAGRQLSAARDAEVIVQAVDGLSERFAGRVPKPTFDAIQTRFEAERDPARARLLEFGLTTEVAGKLGAIRSRTDEWHLRHDGWRAIEPGLVRSYRRGRGALEHVRTDASVDGLHDWRKRTKDLWYHLRFLSPISPGIVRGQAKDAHQLADALGDDHDLAVLREQLDRAGGELAVDLEPMFELIGHRREQLQQQAVLIGERLYAEKPKAFGRRMHRYWRAWEEEARAAGARRPTEPALG